MSDFDVYVGDDFHGEIYLDEEDLPEVLEIFAPDKTLVYKLVETLNEDRRSEAQATKITLALAEAENCKLLLQW